MEKYFISFTFYSQMNSICDVEEKRLVNVGLNVDMLQHTKTELTMHQQGKVSTWTLQV